MHHWPDMNRNIWGVRLILRPCLEHRVLCVCSRWKFDHQDTNLFVIQFLNLISQRLQVHWVRLATANLGLKECAVTKEFCKHSLPVNVCNLLNHFHNKCKLKVSNMPTQNASYTYKIIKFISSLTNANQMISLQNKMIDNWINCRDGFDFVAVFVFIGSGCTVVCGVSYCHPLSPM